MIGKILVTGSLGQIGSALVPALVERYGSDRVVASDIRVAQRNGKADAYHQEQLDCCDMQQIQEVVRRHNVQTIYHMAALLSAVAEEKPQVAWTVNMNTLYNVLEVGRQYQCALFFPSSIGAFGSSTPRDQTPQITIQRPNSMYGVTKVSGELLCDYYASRFDMDTRGIRLPGLISHGASPGGGTTDYAVEMFYQAVRYAHYTCFLANDTALDMMYMPDAVRAMIELMEADAASLNHRNAYNVSAMSFTPAQLADAIREKIPSFRIDYAVDPVRQAIAESWPRAMDDRAARTDWGWCEHFDIAAMTEDMLRHIGNATNVVAS